MLIQSYQKNTSLLTNSANLPTDKLIDGQNNKFKNKLRTFPRN